MTKILILNVGWSNKGNLALIYSTTETIMKFVPDAEFTFMGPRKENNEGFQVKEHVGGGLSLTDPKRMVHSMKYIIYSVYIGRLKPLISQKPLSTKSKLFDYYDCDIVINSGGDSMSGEYGIASLNSFVNILYAILIKKPVVLYGESLGYFKRPILNYIARCILNRINLILIREDLSKIYLEKIKIDQTRIYVTADPAFLLTPVQESDVYKILSDEGISKMRRPIIGINPSGLISRFREDRQNANEDTTTIFAKTIDNLVESLGANIIMIPHVYDNTVDDRATISLIYSAVKNKSAVEIIKGEYKPQELKGIIGLCDLFIGARMHATIASTSMCVPTIGIAYSHKMYGIIGEMLGQSRYIIDIKELNYEKLIATIDDAWTNREKIKTDLEVVIPDVKEKAMLNGRLVGDLIRSLKK